MDGRVILNYASPMTRTETIASITSKLAEADDETVQAIADFVQSMTPPLQVRPLSERERGLLEQSGRDFENGDTLTMEESIARTDALFARHRAAEPSAS